MRTSAQTVTLMRTSAAECAVIGQKMAARLSAARGPVAVFIPSKGWSALDKESGPFWNPEADARLVEALESGLRRTTVEVIHIDAEINDETLVNAMVNKLHAFLSNSY